MVRDKYDLSYHVIQAESGLQDTPPARSVRGRPRKADRAPLVRARAAHGYRVPGQAPSMSSSSVTPSGTCLASSFLVAFDLGCHGGEPVPEPCVCRVGCAPWMPPQILGDVGDRVGRWNEFDVAGLLDRRPGP